MEKGNLSRRTFMKTAALAVSSLALTKAFGKTAGKTRKPNIIFILCDDLGYAEVGCYGQKKIKTPNIDRMAAEGMRFTQHYSGNTVCAPSRCVLMTGKHTGHAYVRDNYEVGGWEENDPEGQLPLQPNTFTIATMLKNQGYRTGGVGKWGLGGPGSTGEPNTQGFDHWYGYLCQRIAHNYYPTHLWRDGKRENLQGNVWKNLTGKHYAPDLMTQDALEFIRDNKDKPFFLYYATNIPHAALQVPEDSLAEYKDKLEDTPYNGNKGYLPHPAPRAAYAAMVTRMDREVGRMMDLVKELGVDDNTIFFFTSDNGPTFNGGTDSTYFESAGPFRGLKCSLYEGGIRVPMIVRWAGHIAPGATTDHVSAFWDVMPTLAEAAGAKPPTRIDGISFLPTLLGRKDQKRHEHLYWEYTSTASQAVRMGDWKGVRHNLNKNPDAPLELYNLKTDIAEKANVADQNPEIAKNILSIMKTGRTESKEFPLFSTPPPKQQ